MDTASRPARQPRISWLMLQKKRKNLSDPSGCTIKNKTLACTPKKSMLGNLTISTSCKKAVFRSADIRWLVCHCHCELLPRADGLSAWHNRASKSKHRRKCAVPSNASVTPTSNGLNVTRSSLSPSHEPAWKLSGLVNGETPTASLSDWPVQLPV